MRKIPASLLALSPRVSASLVQATETALDVVNTCFRAGGAGSVRDGTSMQRRFRDIHTFSQHAAAAEGWYASSGAALLGMPVGFSV
jgi:alkylation response protein AidB-like acyl-CoA dehydrogenase